MALGTPTVTAVSGEQIESEGSRNTLICTVTLTGDGASSGSVAFASATWYKALGFATLLDVDAMEPLSLATPSATEFAFKFDATFANLIVSGNLANGTNTAKCKLIGKIAG